jgi:hypothetical protein
MWLDKLSTTRIFLPVRRLHLLHPHHIHETVNPVRGRGGVVRPLGAPLTPAGIAVLSLVNDEGQQEVTGGCSSEHYGDAGLCMIANLLCIFHTLLENGLFVGAWILTHVRFISIDDVCGGDASSKLLKVVEELLHLGAAERCPAALDQVGLPACQLQVASHEAADEVPPRKVVCEPKSHL